MSEMEDHNRRLQEELDKAKKLAETYKQEFLESDTPTNLSDKILRDAKVMAATRLVWLVEHGDLASVQLNAAKYILEFDKLEPGSKGSLEELVKELSK